MEDPTHAVIAAAVVVVLGFVLGFRIGWRFGLRRVAFDVGTLALEQEHRNRAARNACKGKRARNRRALAFLGYQPTGGPRDPVPPKGAGSAVVRHT